MMILNLQRIKESLTRNKEFSTLEVIETMEKEIERLELKIETLEEDYKHNLFKELGAKTSEKKKKSSKKNGKKGGRPKKTDEEMIEYLLSFYINKRPYKEMLQTMSSEAIKQKYIQQKKQEYYKNKMLKELKK